MSKLISARTAPAKSQLHRDAGPDPFRRLSMGASLCSYICCEWRPPEREPPSSSLLTTGLPSEREEHTWPTERPDVKPTSSNSNEQQQYDLDETSETSPPSSSRSYPPGPDSSKSGRSGKEPTVPHQWHPRFVSYEDWPPDRPLFSTYSSSSVPPRYWHPRFVSHADWPSGRPPFFSYGCEV